MQPAAVGGDAFQPDDALLPRLADRRTQGLLDAAQGRLRRDQLFHARFEAQDRCRRPPGQRGHARHVIAVGAAEAHIEQEHLEVPRVEQPPGVLLRRSGRLEGQQRVLGRVAAEHRRHVAHHPAVEDRVRVVRGHVRVRRLGEEAAELQRRQRRIEPAHRVAVVIQDRDCREIHKHQYL